MNKSKQTVINRVYNEVGFVFAGKLKPTMAFMSGKLKIKGDMSLAIKMEKMMALMNKSKL